MSVEREAPPPELLRASELRKVFGGVVALSRGDLVVRPGEVMALLGENGAGKSTMLSIVAGLERADAGSMTLGGAPYTPGSAAAARAHGVAIVPQEPTLCASLTVAENIVLGIEPTRFGLVDRGARDAAAARALAPLKVDVDPRRDASSLAPAERQLVCIARALANEGTKLVILDEPTSSLTLAEAEQVLTAVRELAASGIAVLYVSHTLGEVVRVADAFTVLRNGLTVETGKMEGTSVHDLTTLLLGHPETPRPSEAPSRGEPRMGAKGLAGSKLPVDASFELAAGEVLGVFGLMGAGRTELVRALFGLDPVRSGEVTVKGAVSRGRTSPARRLAMKVGMVSEDRKGEGLALSMSVADNLTLSRLETVGRFGLVDAAMQRSASETQIAALAIKTSGPDAPVSTLSGGNQQKVAIGRLLHHGVDVLLLDEPTRGIDIKSREQLFEVVRGLARAGSAVLWISSQPSELLRVCDRVAVMRRGHLGEAKPVAELTEQSLLVEAAA